MIYELRITIYDISKINISLVKTLELKAKKHQILFKTF